ncbi:MAG TPA: hypothetical protein VKQ36_01035 [Ktedonobacterales bacterium]|nr:hypothetical protein [Ktedonobacterales bacterium]
MATEYQYNEESEQRERAPQEAFVEADSTPEDELIEKGTQELGEAQAQQKFADGEQEAATILESLGRGDLAKSLHHDAGFHEHKAEQSMHDALVDLHKAQAEHQRRKLYNLALKVVEEPGKLAPWQEAVKTVTRAIRHEVSEDQLLAAAEGDDAYGQQLLQARRDAIALGEGISRSAHRVEQPEQAFHLLARIAEFVAATLTLYDHLPESVKLIVGHALQVLGIFRV